MRHLVPGTWFELAEHPIHDQDGPEDRQFIVTRVSFTAENNLLADLSAEAKQYRGGSLTTQQSTPPYRNTLTAVRRHIPLVPEYHQTAHQKPTAKGLTTATVVARWAKRSSPTPMGASRSISLATESRSPGGRRRS